MVAPGKILLSELELPEAVWRCLIITSGIPQTTYTLKFTSTKHTFYHCLSMAARLELLWNHSAANLLPSTSGACRNLTHPMAYTHDVTNSQVHPCTACKPIHSIVRTRRLQYFGHLTRVAALTEDRQTIKACLGHPSPCWTWLRGRPSGTMDSGCGQSSPAAEL